MEYKSKKHTQYQRSAVELLALSTVFVLLFFFFKGEK